MLVGDFQILPALYVQLASDLEKIADLKHLMF
jgi:hypothetical protein